MQRSSAATIVHISYMQFYSLTVSSCPAMWSGDFHLFITGVHGCFLAAARKLAKPSCFSRTIQTNRQKRKITALAQDIPLPIVKRSAFLFLNWALKSRWTLAKLLELLRKYWTVQMSGNKQSSLISFGLPWNLANISSLFRAVFYLFSVDNQEQEC